MPMNPRIRRPWLAALIAFFSTFLGMLYVGRGRRAFAWLAIFILTLVLLGGLYLLGWRKLTLPLVIATYGATLLGMVDAFRIARRDSDKFTSPWYSRWYSLVGIYAGLILLVFGVRAFIIEPFHIPSGAMTPTLRVGDYIFAYKLPYGNYGAFGIWLTDSPRVRQRPQRGDTIVFRFPGDPSIFYIKRVVGLPGDHIVYRNKILYVNDKSVESKLLHHALETLPGEPNRPVSVYEERLGDTVYTVQHDEGKDFSQVDVVVPDGNYFVLGDNRDRSNDSRYWGSVPEKNLIGRLVMIWLSIDPKNGDLRPERNRVGFR